MSQGAALEGRAADAARRAAGARRQRRAGIWLNLGHGSSGWALACGSARVLADRDRRPRSRHRPVGGLTPAAAAVAERCRTRPREPGPCLAMSTAPSRRSAAHPAAARRLAGARRGGQPRADRSRGAGRAPAARADGARRRGGGAAGAGAWRRMRGASGWPAGRATTAATAWWRRAALHGAGLVGSGHLLGDAAAPARRCAPGAGRCAAGRRAGARTCVPPRRRRSGASTPCSAWAPAARRTAPLADAVQRSNRFAAPVLAVDLPSGLHADTGAAPGRQLPCAPRTRWRC